MDLTAEQIVELVQSTIKEWHDSNENRSEDYEIVTEEIRKIKPLNEHREDLKQVIRELAVTNTEMWHEEDKVRSMKDDVVLKAIRNINPLNQHRNDLMEEVDEIIIEQVKRR